MKKIQLWHQVLIALILGVVAGVILGDKAEDLKIFGTIFITLVKMVIVPLMFFAIVSGVTSLAGDAKSMARISSKGMISYMATSLFAVSLGIVFGLVFSPGESIDVSLFSAIQDNTFTQNEPSTFSLTNFLLGILPQNPIKVMYKENFLQLVVFSIFVGVSINMTGKKADIVKDICDSASQVTFKMVNIIMKLAPLGAFGFMSYSVGLQGLDVLSSLAKLIATVVAACLSHYILLGLAILFIAKLSPLKFYKKMLFTQSLALATSSSKAVLPTAIIQVQDRLGISKSTSNFMMPLGASMNMDGTAIYLGICAIFFSQAYGINLTFADYTMLILTCTLGSIGGAGIPSGSLFFMGMVLTSIGIPVEGIGFIIAVDRILDMLRTALNVTSDAAITLVIDNSEKNLDKKIYNSDN
jgi:Na+/H+-dicarboxylate symporter